MNQFIPSIPALDPDTRSFHMAMSEYHDDTLDRIDEEAQLLDETLIEEIAEFFNSSIDNYAH